MFNDQMQKAINMPGDEMATRQTLNPHVSNGSNGTVPSGLGVQLFDTPNHSYAVNDRGI